MARLTIIRPICGLEEHLEETLESSYSKQDLEYRVIFCVQMDDPAFDVALRVVSRHLDVESKILTDAPGDAYQNPKLANVAKAWDEVDTEWVAVVDSNAMVYDHCFDGMIDKWYSELFVGAMASPPIGDRPATFPAEVECAFLNTHQAVWQQIADFLGIGFAQGKVLFFRKELIDAMGGLRALNSELAEDAALTKLVRSHGLYVTLARVLFKQPLGHRTWRQVWDRQLRWSILRRKSFPFTFSLELLTTPVPFVLLALIVPWYYALLLYAGIKLCESNVALGARWYWSKKSLIACVVRDMMLLPLWIISWFKDDYVWRK